MAQRVTGNYVPAAVPGEDLTAEDMQRVTADDFADILSLSRRYCAVVDSTRSRKRKDGSATISRGGHAPYGTDDVSDDVAQDAAIMYAAKLRDLADPQKAVAYWVDTREPAYWDYERKDGRTFTISRKTMQKWAVRDAAARNGYRMDIAPNPVDETPGAQMMRGLQHAEPVAMGMPMSAASFLSESAWRNAWGEGKDYPTLRDALFLASEADDLGRRGIIGTIAQARYGGAWLSSRQNDRVSQAGRAEWRDLSARLDEARNDLIPPRGYEES
jgi:hypothetical protein